MMDDYSVVSGDDLEQTPPPSAKKESNHTASSQYEPELAHAERQLSQLQKRLAQVCPIQLQRQTPLMPPQLAVDTGSESHRQSSFEEHELLIETRGLVRYTAFRIRRARRLREQQQGPGKDASPRKQLPNGIPKSRKPTDMQSSTASLDAYDDEPSSSRITSLGGSGAQEKGSSGTAPTELDPDEANMNEDTIVQTPKDTRVTDLAQALREGRMPEFDLEAVIAAMRDGLERQSPDQSPSTAQEKKRVIKEALDNVPIAAGSPPARQASKPQSPAQRTTSQRTTPQNTPAKKPATEMPIPSPSRGKEIVKKMATNMEEDVDSFIYQMMMAAYDGLMSAWVVVSHTGKWGAEQASAVSSNKTFQGVVLGLILYRILLVLEVGTQAPALIRAVGP